MTNLDRRDIAGLLLDWFPSMENATSHQWHFFLDNATGLTTPLDTPNAVAFDNWRQKLKELGYPVFPYDAANVEAMKQAAQTMLEAEQARAAAMGKTLADLAKEAPNWPYNDMIASGGDGNSGKK